MWAAVKCAAIPGSCRKTNTSISVWSADECIYDGRNVYKGPSTWFQRISSHKLDLFGVKIPAVAYNSHPNNLNTQIFSQVDNAFDRMMDLLRCNEFIVKFFWHMSTACRAKYSLCLNNISTFHNIRPPKDQRVLCVAVMMMTVDHPNRVVPLNLLKYVVELQHMVRVVLACKAVQQFTSRNPTHRHSASSRPYVSPDLLFPFAIQ